MKRKFHKPEQIVKKLRETDAALSAGKTVGADSESGDSGVQQRSESVAAGLVADNCTDGAD